MSKKFELSTYGWRSMGLYIVSIFVVIGVISYFLDK